ncbi:hypothetical protein [Fontivita pretiosa]|uniref:hypothetical protein n=1 Tax=Fontivita pretiosa TaxID=2989684 RepID=UPI003D16AA70
MSVTSNRRFPPVARFIHGLLCGVVVALAAPASIAATYSIDLDPNDTLFGRLDQDDISPGGTGATGANSCVPTATMNSFIFLQNRYPNIYGNNNELSGTHNGDWDAAAEELAGPNYMNTDPNQGTTDSNWVRGKVAWLETYAPGKTVYHGQDFFDLPNEPAWLADQTVPTLWFIWEQLSRGQDVEIGITPLNAQGNPDGTGHAMTLSSINWNDANNNMTFDAGDTASLDGIDPANPANDFVYELDLIASQGQEFLSFAGGPYANYRIDVVLAESPVPLPPAVAAGMAAMAAVAAWSRRRTTHGLFVG